MKKFFATLALIGLVASISSVAHATWLNVGDTIRLLDGPGAGGGEFIVAMAPGSTELFRTFCVEKNEYIDFSSAGFKVDSISMAAVGGGLGGGSPDFISGETAWLYEQYRLGNLGGLGYDGSATEANKLQAAIWYFETETGDPGTNAYKSAAIGASAAAKTAALSRVRVLNLSWATSRSGYSAGSLAQSQLYYIPEPASIAVWTLLAGGIAGLVVARRRRNK